MERKDVERLKRYLSLITRKQGGIDAHIAELATRAPAAGRPAFGAASALESAPFLEAASARQSAVTPPVDPQAARTGLETLAQGRTPSPAEFNATEAIIKAEIRPAIDVINGTFTVTHPLWRKLSADAAIRQRIEDVMPSIGRIELPGNASYPYGGTGFVVGDGLIMTNRHVAEIFTRGLGDRKLTFVTGAKAGIDFLREYGRPTGPTLKVKQVKMVHPYWDMALLEVEGLAQTHPPLKLSLQDARQLAGREIFVVGYPAFDPRNPEDVQQNLFGGRYGVKRLQPGELQTGMQTASFGKMVLAATHDCSTLGGNSGSAVLDLDTGTVLALHFGGRYQEENYGVPAFELSRDSRVVQAGVNFEGTPSGGPNTWGDWWKRADDTELADARPSDGGATTSAPRSAPASTPAASLTTTAGDGSVTIQIPLHITVSLGGAVGAGLAATARPTEAAEDTTEAMREPFRDTDYAARDGYDPHFLAESADAGAGGYDVPMPQASDANVLAPTLDGGDVLDYQNFSIRMHAKRRLALVTASNVTKEPALRKPEAGRDYSRKGLSGLGANDMERWFLDPRMDARHQLPDVFFTKDRKAFDKGHIVRRDDVAWGKTYEILRRANGDSYHVTNCSPQVAGFNQSNKGEENWGDLENHVLSEAGSERLCVLAGAVLDPKDEVFVGVGDSGALRAKIPSRYWKVIVSRVGDGLAAYGFVLEQDLSDVQWEFVVPEEFAPAMYPLSDIAAMTGVVFDQKLLDADQYDTVRGTEVAMRSSAKRKRQAGYEAGAQA